MEFSATWSSGSVPSDFDFLMSFVAHVTDTYPTSVFDVAYRPVMLTGVMLTGGSKALQNRSAALARDAPMGFQLALGLPEDAKGWWYTPESITAELAIRWGASSTIGLVFDAHPDVIGSLFKPEAYGLRGDNNMTLRHAGDSTYLWVPKASGSAYSQLSVQTASDHARPASYQGNGVAPSLVARNLQSKFDKHIHSRVAASSSSPSPSASSSSNNKRGAPTGDVEVPSGRAWASVSGPAGSLFCSYANVSTGETRTFTFTPVDTGTFSTTCTTNDRPSSLPFRVMGAAEAGNLLTSAESWNLCTGFDIGSTPRSADEAGKEEYKRGFRGLAARSRVAAGWAAKWAISLPPRVLGVLWRDRASSAAAAPGDSSDRESSDIEAEETTKEPLFYLFDPPTKPFSSAPVGASFFSASCEGFVLTGQAATAFTVGAAPARATEQQAKRQSLGAAQCSKCALGRHTLLKRGRRAAQRDDVTATHPQTTSASLADEPWNAMLRQESLSKKVCTLRGKLNNNVEALTKSEGLLVMSVEENKRLPLYASRLLVHGAHY